MKICWDNIEDVYLTNKGNLRRGNSLLIYKKSCMNCGEPYLGDKSDSSIYCSKECAYNDRKPHSIKSKSKISTALKNRKFSKKHRLNISKSRKGIIFSEEHIKNLSKSNKGKHSGSKSPAWKGGVKKANLPLYDTYAQQLYFAEEVKPYLDKDNRKLLQIKCTKCENFYVPKRDAVVDRIRSLNGKKPGEHRFYCSQKCKDNCEIYGKNYRSYLTMDKIENIKSYTNHELSVWSKEVLKNANYICEICGNKATQAHHIKPKKLEPFFALDLDNGIACCKKCHNKHCHVDECSTWSLSRVKCK